MSNIHNDTRNGSDNAGHPRKHRQTISLRGGSIVCVPYYGGSFILHRCDLRADKLNGRGNKFRLVAFVSAKPLARPCLTAET